MAVAAPASFKQRLNEGRVSGQVNVSYQVTDDILTYATLAHGNKSGGVNLTQLPAGATSVVAPETIDSAELGAKTRFFDKRLTLNATLFYERDKNYQYNKTVGSCLLIHR